jgi:aspartyl-tRNA(Asn)/glutamyl-tRNA(Gln) amidotransferase subunit A
MAELTKFTLEAARNGLDKKDFTAVELTRAYRAAMEDAKALNAYITETPDMALEMAGAADAAIAAGQAGPLTGIPIAVKDLFCTKGVRTTAASHMLETFVPRYESTVTARLWDAGAVMLGKTNLDEFAMGSSNESSHFGPCENPWRTADGRARTPGGSSGGSAAAVAAGIALGATGTDTGGSIRQPAAYCGTVGVKPTYGRCSRWGIVAYASSLDQAGVFGRTVKDSATMLTAMCGHDRKDSTSAPKLVPDFAAAMTGDVKGLRIGIPKEYDMTGLSPEIKALWEQGAAWLKAAGADIREVSLPHTRYALATYYIVAPSEASSNLARYDGVRFGLRVPGDSLDDMYEKTRAEGFGEEVQRRILIGTYTLSAGYYDAYYLKAQKLRTLIYRDFMAAYGEVDAILTPAAPTAAFALGETTDPVTMYMNDVFTVPASLAGLPGLCLPAGMSADGLPLGLQLLARPFDEETLFRVAGVLEEAAAFQDAPKPWWGDRS